MLQKKLPYSFWCVRVRTQAGAIEIARHGLKSKDLRSRPQGSVPSVTRTAALVQDALSVLLASGVC